jgi:hypothetical protein
MQLHMHCRALFSSSWWSEQIDDVDFFDWDCDWFWRVTTFACSTIFKFFLTTFLYSRIVSAKWTFLSIVLFCKIQLSQNVEAHFRSAIKNFLDEHRFEIEEIFNVENQNAISEIFSINYLNFDLIFEWRLLQCLKFLVQLFFYLIVDFLVFND